MGQYIYAKDNPIYPHIYASQKKYIKPNSSQTTWQIKSVLTDYLVKRWPPGTALNPVQYDAIVLESVTLNFFQYT